MYASELRNRIREASSVTEIKIFNMSVLLVSKNRDLSSFREALLELDPDLDVDIWPAIEKPERVQFAVAWNQPKHLFGTFPNLKAVSSLGAGVDHLLEDESIPEDVKITRISGGTLATQISDYVLAALLSIVTRLRDYEHAASWEPLDKRTRENLSVGVLGLGSIGMKTARLISQIGFRTLGLSRTKKEVQGVETFSSDEMDDFLTEVNVLVNLLPLTPQTEGILNLDHFKKMRRPGFLIHAGRGEHLVDEDLIYAIDTDLIQHAWLDAFSQEPLPSSHAFWSRKQITVTPHIAGISRPKETALQILENYKRLISGIELNDTVDRKKGY